MAGRGGHGRRQAWIGPLLLAAMLHPAPGACTGSRERETSQDETVSEAQYEKARARMVRAQIENRGVSDPDVLRAMRQVPRHRFVAEDLRSRAYDDYPLPIGYDQTISQPYIVAFMTELLELGAKDKVLEIGTGSGYQAAVLAELAAEVYTIEIVEPLAARARQVLEELGCDNVHVRAGDGYAGWPEKAPFDAIILTAAPPEIPQPLIDQLAVGGVLVAPVGDWDQELVVVRKDEHGITRREGLPVRFVPMTGRAQQDR